MIELTSVATWLDPEEGVLYPHDRNGNPNVHAPTLYEEAGSAWYSKLSANDFLILTEELCLQLKRR